MRAPVSRRGFLGRLGAAAALAAGWGLGWSRREATTALGAVKWKLCAPLTGRVGTSNFHADNALDFFAANGTNVKLYVFSETGLVGSGKVTSIRDSCSTVSNPEHKRVQFNIRTNTGTVISPGVASHIKPVVAVGNVISGNGGQIGNLNGGKAVTNCYDPYHTHYGASGMSGVGNWANTSVTAGFHAPWEKYL